MFALHCTGPNHCDDEGRNRGHTRPNEDGYWLRQETRRRQGLLPLHANNTELQTNSNLGLKFRNLRILCGAANFACADQ
jgi:hypothetical protein